MLSYKAILNVYFRMYILIEQACISPTTRYSFCHDAKTRKKLQCVVGAPCRYRYGLEFGGVARVQPKRLVTDGRAP